MAREVVATAAALGERLEYRNITKEDGNCFYHALLDQIGNRPEVNRLTRREVTGSYHLADHVRLRQAIVRYVRDAVTRQDVPRAAVRSDEFLESHARQERLLRTAWTG